MEGDRLNEKEAKVFKETRIRNLERYFAKLSNIPELAEEAIEVKCEIDALKREMKYQM